MVNAARHHAREPFTPDLYKGRSTAPYLYPSVNVNTNVISLVDLRYIVLYFALPAVFV